MQLRTALDTSISLVTNVGLWHAHLHLNIAGMVNTKEGSCGKY